MSNRLLKYIVIFQGILIIFAFIALIYGIYSKITVNKINYNFKEKDFILKLSNGQKITNIELINQDELMINLSESNAIKAVIYSMKEKRILTIIKK